jgi:hypothetical protein
MYRLGHEPVDLETRLEGLDRTALKKAITENGLNVRVLRSMSDEDLREDIYRQVRQREQEDQDEKETQRMLEGQVDRREVAGEVRGLNTRNAARRWVKEQEAAADTAVFTLPDPSRTLADDLAEPPRERRYTIDGLHPVGGNTVCSAGFKTGKSTLLLNLAQSLADEQPFLGVFDTCLTGRLALWNYELDPDTFRRWMSDLDVRNTDRVAAPFHLRGYKLPFWIPSVRDPLCEWLSTNEVGFLIIDPATEAWRGLVSSSNDNDEMVLFTAAVDEIKRLAGVQDVVISHHTGRKVHEEGAEHGRGATKLSDWPDALWYLVKDKSSSRSLRAEGRDVQLDATVLDYDPNTRTLTSTGRTRVEERQTRRVVDALLALWHLKRDPAGRYPAPHGEWQKAMDGENAERQRAIQDAVRAGYVDVEVGAKNAHLHRFTKAGLRALKDGYKREMAQ